MDETVKAKIRKTDDDDGKEIAPVVENVEDSAFPMVDLILVVEGKELYVNSQILKEASPVFKTMLESNFKEKGQTRIELPGKTYKAMAEFLKCTYPFINASITVNNVLLILPLADEYQTDLKNKCEEFIINLLLGKSDFFSNRTDIFENDHNVHVSNSETSFGDTSTLEKFYEPGFGKEGFPVQKNIVLSGERLISYALAAEMHGLERLLIVVIRYMSMRNYSHYEMIDGFNRISTDTRMKLLMVRVRMLEQHSEKVTSYAAVRSAEPLQTIYQHLIRT